MVTNSGDLDSATVYYYNKNQIIETRDGSDNLETQVYHGTRYIDEIVGMRLPQGRVYLHQDANYNVIAMTDLTGRELERYHYTPYGELEVSVESHMFDYDDDGDVDENDIAAGTSSGVCWGNYSGDCVRLDADCDEDIDVDDYNAIVAYVDTLSSDTEVQRVPSTTSSKLGNMFGHQGLVFDAEIGSYQNRARQYAPKAKRFMQRDPLTFGSLAASGYRDGMGLGAYCRSNPVSRLDSSGKCSRCTSNCGGEGHPKTTPSVSENRNGWTIWLPCAPHAPYWNCHGYAFGIDNWIQAQQASPDGYPTPPDGSTSAEPPSQSPPEDPCPPGYCYVAQTGTADGWGHSMVLTCKPDGSDCGWYQKCGGSSVDPQNYGTVEEALEACNYVPTPDTESYSCVPE